jgi:hypothetical protein
LRQEKNAKAFFDIPPGLVPAQVVDPAAAQQIAEVLSRDSYHRTAGRTPLLFFTKDGMQAAGCIRKNPPLRYRNPHPIRQTITHDDSAGSIAGTCRSSCKKEHRTTKKDGPARQEYPDCIIGVLSF